MNRFNKKNYIYTAYFCEENIWKLLERSIDKTSIDYIDVLFIINPTNSVAAFNQNMSEFDEPIIWDYHVVASAKLNNEIVIFDFDSRCEFPCDIDIYFSKTFAKNNELKPIYQPYLRRINARYFFKYFTSDRTHMLNIIPQKEHPNYDIIKPSKGTNIVPLNICRSMDSIIENSSIMTPVEYLKFISILPQC